MLEKLKVKPKQTNQKQKQTNKQTKVKRYSNYRNERLTEWNLITLKRNYWTLINAQNRKKK